ncbi:unnamed protein product [Linum trigynum]|uniref:Secreted protein n=1 Tax=Linum trigynum TaxID=586398 RepID=A0AAV2GV70_9ROSI
MAGSYAIFLFLVVVSGGKAADLGLNFLIPSTSMATSPRLVCFNMRGRYRYGSYSFFQQLVLLKKSWFLKNDRQFSS